MNVYEATYGDFRGMSTHAFDKSYQKWIKEHIKKSISKYIVVTFTEKSFIIDATKSTPLQLVNAAIFIGYAFGQQNNGR